MIDRVIKDVASIVKGEFSKEITITPTGGTPFIINGLPVRITEVIEQEASSMLSPFSHVTIIEQDLVDNGVTPRTAEKLATLKGWGVSWTDAVQTWNYVVKETLPDSTVGSISLVLKDV